MAYTDIDKSDDYFNPVIYTGDGTTNQTKTITFGFQPDLAWFKARDAAQSHILVDSVRGGTKYLVGEATNAEATFAVAQLFTSTGMIVSNDASANSMNSSGSTKVSWGWLAGGTAVSNTDGTITSSVSANTDSGFSIVTYTGNGVAGATIGHGLGVKPAMMIIKNRISGAESWQVYHQAYGTGTQYFLLNSNDAVLTFSTVFNNTAPDVDKFTVGTAGGTNGSSQGMIAYCFAEVKGYSKFGSYTGNGSADGTFIYTGFKPAFFIVKCSDSAFNWVVEDNKRNTFNVVDKYLLPNTSGAEGTFTLVDFLSNGIKIRTTDTSHNGSGNTYIYMAFAENPFVTSTGIPTPAR